MSENDVGLQGSTLIVEQTDARDVGWRCAPCGWETFDLADMHNLVNWPEPNGVTSLVCPRCGAEGQFEDAFR
jgi:hypothetical protein